MTCFTWATRNTCRGSCLPGQKGRTGQSTHNNIAKPICLRLILRAIYLFAGLLACPRIVVPSSHVQVYVRDYSQVPTLIFSYHTSHSLTILFNMPSRFLFFSFFYAISTAVAASQKCYSLTGTQLDDTFAPCNLTAKHSGCCATNKKSGADICLDSGLCMATQNEFMGTVWQPGCTDSTGKATECPHLCPGSMFNHFAPSRGDGLLTRSQ